MPEALAVFCSDLHLTSRCPACRDPETWITDQQDMLMKIVGTCIKYGAPLCIAGDIFHRAKEDPLIESIAIRELSKLKGSCYTIPGQHDLPGHSYKRLGESSYGVLYETRFIQNCPRYVSLGTGPDAMLYGIPYGEEIPILEKQTPNMILMAHEMVWNKEPYPGAPESGNVDNIYKKMKSFRMGVFGDNHQGFFHTKGKKRILNCGVGIQRTMAEVNYKPFCYVLLSNFVIKKVPLPTTKNFLETKASKKEDMFDTFIKTLQEKEEVSLSFRKNVEITLDKIKASDRLRDMVWDIMERCNE